MAGTNNSWNNQITGSYNQIILNAGTNGVAISTDAAAATVNVATGGAVKTTTLGSTNSTSATTVQSGSGALNVTSTNGALTINSGTGALGISTDGSATTVSIATGGAVKTVTVGSTNTTSALTLNSGSGGIKAIGVASVVVANKNYVTINTSTGALGSDAGPASVSFFANASGNQSITGDATVVFDNIVFNNGSGYSSGTNTFTAPNTGIYFIQATILLDGHLGDALTLQKNGSGTLAYVAQQQITGGGVFLTTTVSIILSLAATDTIKVIFLRGSGINGTISGQATYVTYFMGYQIS